MTLSGNRMAGKICVVTGATQGLGAAIAHRLAAAGAAGIIVTGRNAARGAAVAQALRETQGSKAHFIAADFCTIDDCRAAIAQTDRLFGRLDMLVNAGALTDRGTILNTSPALFNRMFAVNVRGPYFLMQDAIKLMIRDGVQGAVTIGIRGAPAVFRNRAAKTALSPSRVST